MTTLKILKACHGDAFILEVTRGDDSFTMVIDGGPRLSLREVLPKLNELKKIDLLVLTHFDSDHIYGIIEFLKDKEKAKLIKEYWLNLPHLAKLPSENEEVSYDEAKTLKDFMESLSHETDHEIKWKDEITEGFVYDDEKKLVKITVLAPFAKDKLKNEKAYYAEISEETSNETEAASPKEETKILNLKDLAEKDYSDASKINRASIAMLIEAYDGKKLLMTGDAYHKPIVNRLIKMEFSPSNPLYVDIFKLPHHGSKYNINNKLLSLVKAEKYLITTNGGYNGSMHPSRETIAKLIFNQHRDKSEKLNICLNYDLKTIWERNPEFLLPEEINNEDYNLNIEENTEIL